MVLVCRMAVVPCEALVWTVGIGQGRINMWAQLGCLEHESGLFCRCGRWLPTSLPNVPASFVQFATKRSLQRLKDILLTTEQKSRLIAKRDIAPTNLRSCSMYPTPLTSLAKLLRQKWHHKRPLVEGSGRLCPILPMLWRLQWPSIDIAVIPICNDPGRHGGLPDVGRARGTPCS